MFHNNKFESETDVQDALECVQAVLEKNGYKYEEGAESVIVSMGNPSNPLPAIITIADGQLNVTCQLTTLGVIGEDQLSQFLVGALDLNAQITPYATAVISGADEESHCWPVVLLDSVPVADMQESELVSALESLTRALPLAADLIGSFEAQPAASC